MWLHFCAIPVCALCVSTILLFVFLCIAVLPPTSLYLLYLFSNKQGDFNSSINYAGSEDDNFLSVLESLPTHMQAI